MSRLRFSSTTLAVVVASVAVACAAGTRATTARLAQPARVATHLSASSVRANQVDLATTKATVAVVSAVLTEQKTHAAIRGRVVSFYSRSSKLLCEGETTASGIAACVPLGGGLETAIRHGYTAHFKGDDAYGPSSADSMLP